MIRSKYLQNSLVLLRLPRWLCFSYVLALSYRCRCILQWKPAWTPWPLKSAQCRELCRRYPALKNTKPTIRNSIDHLHVTVLICFSNFFFYTIVILLKLGPYQTYRDHLGWTQLKLWHILNYNPITLSYYTSLALSHAMSVIKLHFTRMFLVTEIKQLVSLWRSHEVLCNVHFLFLVWRNLN